MFIHPTPNGSVLCTECHSRSWRDIREQDKQQFLPREGASLAGVVASFYFYECCTCCVLEQDSAGGWTPWLLLSLRSSGSWGWDSSFESMWEEMKLSIGEHGRIGKKRSSVRPMVNRNERVHLVMIQGSKRWKRPLDRGRKLPNSGPRAWELGWGSSVKNGTAPRWTIAGHRAGTVSSGEGKRRVYFRTNHCVCWGTLKLPTEIQGDLHGTSNTSPRWRQCCTILTIHCPSPWPPGSHPALEGLHSRAEAVISPTPALIPPLDSAPSPQQIWIKDGRNHKSAEDGLLDSDWSL